MMQIHHCDRSSVKKKKKHWHFKSSFCNGWSSLSRRCTKGAKHGYNIIGNHLWGSSANNANVKGYSTRVWRLYAATHTITIMDLTEKKYFLPLHSPMAHHMLLETWSLFENAGQSHWPSKWQYTYLGICLQMKCAYLSYLNKSQFK